jgi:hypothetical protein
VEGRAACFDPLLDLAIHLIERSVGRGLRVRDGMPWRRIIVVDDELVSGRVDVNTYSVTVAGAVMVTGELDRDTAGDEAIAETIELIRTSLNLGGQDIRMRRGVIRDL